MIFVPKGYYRLPVADPDIIFDWDASIINGISATLPANNDSVSKITDLSGYGNHVSQSDSGKQPLFKTNIQNSLPGVYFDGSNDFLDLDIDDSESLLTVSTGVTVFCVYQLDVTDTDQYPGPFVAPDDGSIRWGFLDSSRGTFNTTGSSLTPNDTGGSTGGTTYVAVTKWDGASTTAKFKQNTNSYFTDSGGGSTGTLESFTNSTLRIGAQRVGLSRYMGGYLFAQRIVRRYLSDDEDLLVRQWYGDKWGVTVS